jgi:hypothetical protein
MELWQFITGALIVVILLTLDLFDVFGKQNLK